MKRYKNEIEELKEPGSSLEKWIIGFNEFKKETKAATNFASDTSLWQKHVEYFFIDDNVFGTKKFISGLFVYPAFQKLCSENIKPVVQYDCNLYSVTKRLFDLDPISCVNEAEFQSKIVAILNDINIFEVKGENFSSGSAVVRADISISKNKKQICLIELKHLLFGINCDPIYQIGAYYSNMLEFSNFNQNFTYPMLLLAIVGNQYYVYGGINYKKKVQVVLIHFLRKIVILSIFSIIFYNFYQIQKLIFQMYGQNMDLS